MLTILTFLALWFAASVVTVGAYSLLRWLTNRIRPVITYRCDCGARFESYDDLDAHLLDHRHPQ